MAKEIKETPILRGKDAQRFEKMISDNENRKVSKEAYERGKNAYDAIKFVNSK